MANKNFVVRQGTIEILSIGPVGSEFLAITPNGEVVTTGIPSGNFDNYATLTLVGDVSGDLQNQIDSLTAASSGGIASINNVTSPAGNIDLVTNTTEVTITPNNTTKEIAIDVDLSSYILTTTVSSISANLQGQITTNANDITALEADVAFLSGAIDGIVPESTIITSTGGSIVVTSAGPYEFNIEVASAPIQNHNDLLGLQGGTTGEYYHLTSAEYADLIGSTEVAAISANLQGQITTNANDITALEADVAVLSGAIDSIDVVAGTYVSVVESPLNTFTVSVTADFIESSEVAAISANLQSQITTNANDITALEADVAFLSGAIDDVASDLATLDAGLDARFVNVSGDTMTGDLTVPNLVVTNNATINGNLYVNGTEFIVDTETVSASDNIILINGGDPGPGVTAGYAGVRVDRGSADDYFFVFDELRDGFVVGVAVDETSGALSLTQMVATREDNPLVDGYARWNDTLNRFDTVPASTIGSDLDTRFVNVSGDTMTGDLTLSTADLIITNGTIQLDGVTQSYAENLDVDVGTEVIDSFASTLGQSAHWIVSIVNTGNTRARTSIVTAIWLGATINFNETSTSSIGNTNALDLDVVINGGNIELRALNTSGINDWVIKVHRTVV